MERQKTSTVFPHTWAPWADCGPVLTSVRVRATYSFHRVVWVTRLANVIACLLMED